MIAVKKLKILLFVCLHVAEESAWRGKLKNTVLLTLVFLMLLSSALGSGFVTSANNQNPRLSQRESEIIARINGANAYNYDLELERIALNHSLSDYAFRSAGSPGANEAAQWIKRQFESFGLETSMESFEFTNWNLPSKPVLVVDDDGDPNTTNDQRIITSFQSAHYSWSTPKGGVFRDLVTLPLPDVPNHDEIILKPYNTTAWNAINITGKILLVGREVRWNTDWRQAYFTKLKLQPPAAIVYTWWYQWMSFTPPMFGSMGGRLDTDLLIPVGWVSYEDGLWIRNRENSFNVSANFTIPAVIGTGPNYNVVGKLKGSVNPEKIVIISGHYDTVMTSGFCDNGAGTAGVLELARLFTNAAKEDLYHPEYTLLFVAFTGEELGFVGSINFIKQHETQMKNITAVVNLDCIGSDIFQFTETFPNDDGLDLDEIVRGAATDIGIKAVSEETGGSDQEAFRNPKMANGFYDKFWGLNPGISNVSRVKASIMISSFPLFYSDKWTNETAGWIHTEYDNSTSTTTLKWVEVDDLETHIQVAALSIMRVLSYGYKPSLSLIMTFTMLISIGVVVAFYFKSTRVRGALKKTYNSILYYIGTREFLVIIMLTILFLFVSYISHTRPERVEVTVEGLPRTTIMAYYGYPFEMIGIEQQITEASPGPQYEGGVATPPGSLGGAKIGTQIFWNGLFLNLFLYFLLALGLTYLVARLGDMHIFRKSE